jgi:hypothetical protein
MPSSKSNRTSKVLNIVQVIDLQGESQGLGQNSATSRKAQKMPMENMG